MFIRRLSPRFVLTAPVAATVRLHRATVSCAAAVDGTYRVLSRTIVLTNELLTLQVFNGDVQGEVPVRVLGCHPVLEDGEAFYELSLERAEDDIVLPQRTSHAATAMPSPQR